jgi:hypothetical protein
MEEDLTAEPLFDDEILVVAGASTCSTWASNASPSIRPIELARRVDAVDARIGAMLVLTQLSPMKSRRLGSIFACCRFQRAQHRA